MTSPRLTYISPRLGYTSARLPFGLPAPTGIPYTAPAWKPPSSVRRHGVYCGRVYKREGMISSTFELGRPGRLLPPETRKSWAVAELPRNETVAVISGQVSYPSIIVIFAFSLRLSSFSPKLLP